MGSFLGVLHVTHRCTENVNLYSYGPRGGTSPAGGFVPRFADHGRWKSGTGDALTCGTERELKPVALAPRHDIMVSGESG